eukprot:TRINITY_DN66479_c0_g1_i1.p1 TRINITY_DN66479_c0_g1~~TRINITY_DN66479_c0_g1_i1.p1  ORF type:complete len:296 (+),score=85.94 TRINITY_DN66479_c0_g1_i1:165-1052(+)
MQLFRCLGCFSVESLGEGHDHEATGLVGVPSPKKGPMELQEHLSRCKLFASVSLETYCGDAYDQMDGANGSPSSASPTSRRSSKVDSRMIANYLDALGSADGNNQYTLVVKGPMKIQESDNALTLLLDELEVLITEEADLRRFHLKAIKLYDLDVRFPVTSFVNNLLMSGTVACISMSSCTVSTAVMSGGVHISRSPTLRHVVFRSCSLTDAHLGCLQASLRDSTVLVQLQSLHITGSFQEDTMDSLLSLLESSAPALRSLSVPRRHEQFVKQHAIAGTHPHLVLNGKKVRHVLN